MPMFSGALTSGLFPVEFPGNGSTLHLWVSSFARTPHTVPFRVNQVAPDGTKVLLEQGEISVAAGATGRATVTQLDGQTLEVQLNIPDPALKPSLALVGTFLADGAEETLVWISPTGFSPVDGTDGEPGNSADRATEFEERSAGECGAEAGSASEVRTDSD